MYECTHMVPVLCVYCMWIVIVFAFVVVVVAVGFWSVGDLLGFLIKFSFHSSFRFFNLTIFNILSLGFVFFLLLLLVLLLVVFICSIITYCCCCCCCCCCSFKYYFYSFFMTLLWFFNPFCQLLISHVFCFSCFTCF